MTDTSVTPETPNAAETAHFLRRFADMMSVGHNANYLHHAAVWLETLSVQLAAAQDEEQLWRYKYETIAQHTDALEAECEALKHDHDEHLNAVSSALGERDALTSMLQAREAELSELKGQLDHERGERTAASEAHQQALAELHATFVSERETLAAAAAQRDEEPDQLRRQLAEQSKAHELALSELRFGFAGERHDFAARLKVSGDELAAFRVVSEREREALMAKVAVLEAKRAALRSAFDRIGDFKNLANQSQDAAGHRFRHSRTGSRSGSAVESGATGPANSRGRRKRCGGAEGHAASGALPV